MQTFSFMRNCFDENVYIIDLKKNTCILSDKLATTLNLPTNEFPNAFETLLNNVYELDRPLYLSVMSLVQLKKRKDIMLEYRVSTSSNSLIRINNKARIISDSNNDMNYIVGRLIIENNQEHKDSLTGLYNFEHCIQDYESALRRNKILSGFLIKIGIDNINLINERMGKEIGDKVIQIVAKCAEKACDENTFVYRGAEDNFIVMNLKGGTGPDAGKLYSNIKRYISDSENEIDYRVIFTISAGLVAFLDADTSFNDLLQRINFSLRYVKGHGKNSIKTFSFKEYQKHLDKFDLQEQLRLAIKNNYRGFKLYYQPVIDATEINENTHDYSKSSVIGAEALLRWEHPKFGLLGAGEIIPILEEFNLIVPLGRWILFTACKQCKAWNQYLPHFRMSINLSYIQIEKSDLLFDVKNALERSKVNPQNIVLEITESGSLETKDVLPLLKKLHELNIGIDIDDFGTGYSNMRYLQEMNADTLKLDYTMIQKAVKGDGSKKDKIVVDHIAKLAKDLNMKICMEGIETPEDVQKLIGLKPNKFQGFLFGHPMDADSFWTNKLNQNQSLSTLPPVDTETFIDENLSKNITNID